VGIRDSEADRNPSEIDGGDAGNGRGLMPTFKELFHVNLSALQSAADDWAAMAVLLNKVAKEAGSMRSLAQGTEWKGENASVTKPFVVRVSDEFTDTVTEAESIGNLLSSAHDKIKAARNDLKVLCENPPAGITIHADGTLSRSVQPQRMSHGDPQVVVTEDDFDALQRRIDAILGRAAEADSTSVLGACGNSPRKSTSSAARTTAPSRTRGPTPSRRSGPRRTRRSTRRPRSGAAAPSSPLPSSSVTAPGWVVARRSCTETSTARYRA
jgi:hypothetical protein